MYRMFLTCRTSRIKTLRCFQLQWRNNLMHKKLIMTQRIMKVQCHSLVIKNMSHFRMYIVIFVATKCKKNHTGKYILRNSPKMYLESDQVFGCILLNSPAHTLYVNTKIILQPWHSVQDKKKGLRKSILQKQLMSFLSLWLQKHLHRRQFIKCNCSVFESLLML